MAPITSAAALDILEGQWFDVVNRHARQMDLVGDYCGSELFVVDGDALIQHVISNRLLGAAKDGDTSFQLLHAKYIMESFLANLIERDAVFEIVFFEANAHITTRTGSSRYTHASRRLLRHLLFQHLKYVSVKTHVFRDLSDHNWEQYARANRPMFVMTNVNQDGENHAEISLLQRVFAFDLITSGLAIAVLDKVVFKDNKIFTFVLEAKRAVNARAKFSAQIWSTEKTCRLNLDRTSRPQQLHRKETSPDQNTVLRIGKALCQDQSLSKPLSYLFLFHLTILPDLSLRERSQSPPTLNDQLTSALCTQFYPSVFRHIETVLADTGGEVDVDGIVFAKLLEVFTEGHGQSYLEGLRAAADSAWAQGGGGGCDLSGLSSSYPPPAKPDRGALVVKKVPTVLPFSNPVFDAILAPIQVKVMSDSEPPVRAGYLEYGKGTIFNDTTHWHNHRRMILPKHLGGEDPISRDPWAKKRALKKQQKFMAFLFKHATTLTGALGKPLQQQVILSVRPTAKTSTTRVQKQPKPAHAKKGSAPNSKQKLLENIDREKKKKEVDETLIWWKTQLKSLEAVTSISDRTSQLQYVARNKRTEAPWLSLELRLYELHLEIMTWIDDPQRAETRCRTNYTVQVLKRVKTIFEGPLSAVAIKHLSRVLTVLGFKSYIEPLVAGATTDPSLPERLSFKFVSVLESKTDVPVHKFMAIEGDPVRWQLQHFGEHMDRDVDGKPDSRVSFVPDAWQRKVLDCLDEDQSLLVVAPTSAGKTFISFYAMEKVLRESDEGILVYISPTKALVNQITAEVYARFRKDLKANGKSCWAIHTRDYRINNPQNCQILVTVPEMFCIMLLSPTLASTWTPRIKRVILDEIHTIGQEDGGQTWEQILLLVQCPIIGLSATIGHVEVFNDWLESVQRAHGYKHTLVTHPHRYSHLRKHIYIPDATYSSSQVFPGLDEHPESYDDRLRAIHPVSMFGLGASVDTVPSDFSLEPVDTLRLYDTLLSLKGKIPEMTQLDPTDFFKSRKTLLRQKDILLYEKAQCEYLDKILRNPTTDQLQLEGGQTPIQLVSDSLMDPRVKKAMNRLRIHPDEKDLLNPLSAFLADLHKGGNLPALLFCFDRSFCETMCKHVVDELAEAESKWRDHSPEWQRKLAAWKTYKSNQARLAKIKEKQKSQKTNKEEDGGGGGGGPEEAQTSWESSFNPDDPSAQFSFANVKAYSRGDLEKDIREMRWQKVPQWAIQALLRGIGVHHSGMNKGYRSMLESLFRIGYVRVIFATGTLALGINAPTKSSVFVADSPFLSSLMYRQCAGRAGRRGFDLLGKVIFYGLTIERVQRLMLSSLPRLTGSFPLTTTLSLRLLNLLVGSSNAPFAVDAVQRMLSLPHITFGSNTARDQILHHFRFNIDYLRRSGLLDESGRPMNLYGIAAFLYYTEPSNLAMVTLIRSGAIHRICCQPSLIQAKYDFMHLMAHLFGRRDLSPSPVSMARIEEARRKYPSKIILDPLPKEIVQVFRSHDERTLEIFTGYARLYATQYADKVAEGALPLSKKAFKSTYDDDDNSKTGARTPLRQLLMKESLHPCITSPFVANSGHSDNPSSVAELIESARPGLHFNHHAVPSLEHLTDTTQPLNAYLLDFYVHGQVKSLVEANAIRSGDVWYLLQDFVLTLMSIRSVIEQHLTRAARPASSDDSDDDGGASVSDEPGLEDDGNEIGTDSGYFTGTDKAGSTVVDDDEMVHVSDLNFERPDKVSDHDWRVYEVVSAVLVEFNDKFKKMWA